ncbi:MAG TPA: hypothetical protein VKP14_05705 [Gaiellaceae bacterium]|nr:hypothetical protein [Gaiellaceae bacterium]
MMTDLLIRATMPADAHWSYDDPSGVADTTPKPDRRPARPLKARPVRPIFRIS